MGLELIHINSVGLQKQSIFISINTRVSAGLKNILISLSHKYYILQYK